MDNVGEFFFSSPIDNANIWRDYGRSDDDQRHRVVFDGAVHSHGFQLSGMMQYYSALPLNITAGTTTIQGTTARPIVNGDFIGRNVGTGNDFFSVSTRISRSFALSERWRLEAMAEIFQRAESPQQSHAERDVRRGGVPAGAVVHVWAGDGGQRSEKRSTGAAVEVLEWEVADRPGGLSYLCASGLLLCGSRPD